MVVALTKLVNIAASKMFKLTKQEQRVAAFLVTAILLGVAVKEWRARHPKGATLQQMGKTAQ